MSGASAILVIAEAGVNHNGSLKRALRMVDTAAKAGADVVKFQTFKSDQVVSAKAPKAAYQLARTDKAESQLDMIRRLELSEAEHRKLSARARARGIAFLSAPFDLPSVRFLVEDLKLGTLKIPSGEITNAPLLLRIARSKRRVIMSTGMATLAEVETALGVLAFGYTAPAAARPTRRGFQSAFASRRGQAALKTKASLLHCTTEYPAPYAEVNLRAMDTLSRKFGLPVGLSDHTTGIHIAVAAAARGARIIEKHFTLDRSLPGPDHGASLEPDELAELVGAIRDVAASLGDGVKRPMPSELKNRPIARKSLVAAERIGAGEVFTDANLTCKRPGDGRSTFEFWSLLGTRAARAYDKDEAI